MNRMVLQASIAMFLLVGPIAMAVSASAAQVQLTPAAEADRIHHLPGFDGKIPFEQFGGYLTVDEAHGRNLFYWFTESMNDPQNDPLAVWLQGGPGCSSLIGLFTENGPFHVDPSGKEVSLNPYSWSKVANMLYLEAPAGVGFSYSNDKSDYTTNDAKTADDNYVALLEFFKRFPHMNSTSRPFYLLGESYAGHYLPDLAARILLGNTQKQPHINLKGFQDGNPLTDLASNMQQGSWPTYWNHALISPTTHKGFEEDCKTFPAPSPKCDHWQNVAAQDMQFINPYDLYVPVCISAQKRAIAKALAPYNSHLAQYASLDEQAYDPCIDAHLTAFLNRIDVKEVIHAKPSISWTECSNLNYSTADVARSMVPFYDHFFKNSDLKIMIYSGDVDSVCPYLGSIYWIENFGQQVVDPWKPWFYSKQVAGYVQRYDKITLVTVRGAGHMVPEFRAPQALEMFKNYLSGKF